MNQTTKRNTLVDGLRLCLEEAGVDPFEALHNASAVAPRIVDYFRLPLNFCVVSTTEEALQASGRLSDRLAAYARWATSGVVVFRSESDFAFRLGYVSELNTLVIVPMLEGGHSHHVAAS